MPKSSFQGQQDIPDGHFLKGLQSLQQIYSDIRAKLQAPNISLSKQDERDQQLHPFQPGDLVYIKRFPTTTLEAHWTGPHQVILCTPSAIKVAGKTAWIHWTHAKPAPPADPADNQTEKWTIQATNNPLKIRLS